MIGVYMDHGEVEGRVAPAIGHVPQDSPACLGRPPLEAPRGPSPDSTNSGGLRRQAIINGAGGHHRRNGVGFY